MKTASVAEIEGQLDLFLDRNDGEDVIITRNGEPVAVLVPVSGQAGLDRFVQTRSNTLPQILEEADERISRTGGMTHEDFWAAVDARYEQNSSKESGRRQ